MSISQRFLTLKQDQQNGQKTDQHSSALTPVLISSAIQLDLRYRVADEAWVAGQSGIHTWLICMSATQSKTHHPGLHPGPIHHLADEGPSRITLNTWQTHADLFSFHHWEVSKCSKGGCYFQCSFLFVCARVILWLYTEAQTADSTAPGMSPCRPPGTQRKSCHTGCPPARSGQAGTSPDMNSGRWLAPALPAVFRFLTEGLRRIWGQTDEEQKGYFFC